MQDNIKKLLEEGVIECRYNSALVVIPKKSEEVRVCLDARKLNRILIPRYDTPSKIEEVIKKFSGKNWLTSTDVTCGYFNVRLSEDSKKYTAFSLNGIQYCYQVLPFGLKVSGQMFIKCMERCLRDTVKRNLAVYVDDMVVGSSTFRQHIEHLRELFIDIRNAGIKLNLSKTQLAKAELEFVGHIISAGGVRPIENRIQMIQDIGKPNTLKQLRRFIGFVPYYRKFVANFSKLLCPLNELLKKNKRWDWTQVHQKAFEDIKRSFQKCIILRYPRVDEPYLLTCDASGTTVAAVLSQVDERGDESIIEVTSKCLNETVKKYATTEKELLAILHAVKKWRHYLIGNKVTVNTDHQALIFLKKSTGLNARMVRWAMALGEFNLEIKYIKGKDNVVADFLSRDRINDNEEMEKHNFLVGTEFRKRSEELNKKEGTCREGNVTIAQVGVIQGWIRRKERIRSDQEVKEVEVASTGRGDSEVYNDSDKGGWISKKEKEGG